MFPVKKQPVKKPVRTNQQKNAARDYCFVLEWNNFVGSGANAVIPNYQSIQIPRGYSFVMRELRFSFKLDPSNTSEDGFSVVMRNPSNPLIQVFGDEKPVILGLLSAQYHGMSGANVIDSNSAITSVVKMPMIVPTAGALQIGIQGTQNAPKIACLVVGTLAPDKNTPGVKGMKLPWLK